LYQEQLAATGSRQLRFIYVAVERSPERKLELTPQDSGTATGIQILSQMIFVTASPSRERGTQRSRTGEFHDASHIVSVPQIASREIVQTRLDSERWLAIISASLLTVILTAIALFAW
jgi:hypothetical protein